MIGDFHFIRPWWLLATLPLATLIVLIRRHEMASQGWRGVIAPHLLPFLLSGENQRSRLSPLVFIAIGWLLAVIAIAGPTWSRQAAPFAEDTAALAIVVKVTPSMLVEDVQPNRLARSVQKIHDLLAIRGNAKTALIAYAGSAHRVMPLTTDGGIIDTFAQSLDPKIMPSDGDAATEALKLADGTLAGSGSILWITDSVAPEEVASLRQWRKGSSTDVRVLAPLLPGDELNELQKQTGTIEANLIQLTPDDADVSTIARGAKFSNGVASGEGDRWRESGYWLTPVLAALLLPFFRRGWMTPIAARG
jgi:Ca-activated chloride channel homolog